MYKNFARLRALLVVFAVVSSARLAPAESLAEIGARLGRETTEAYNACRFSALSKNYFSRFTRDAAAAPRADELVITEDFVIVLAPELPPVAARMAEHLAEFFAQAMQVQLSVSGLSGPASSYAIRFEIDPTTGEVDGAFRIVVEERTVSIIGHDADGLRDGVVKLADRIGLRRAPYLTRGTQDYAPRLPLRLGAIPREGSYRELVFMGYNALFVGGGSLHALSQSDAIPALAARRLPGLLEQNAVQAAAARAYGLKTYAFIDTRQKFPEDDPVFAEHPEIRGARTWKADGEFVLCTEHPLVMQWLHESVQTIFQNDPQLNGLVLIIGGEGFYHCFMRPFGVEKGHTNCPRCEALGAPTVVANLINGLVGAIREINPKAEVVAWPYSAEHVWSMDSTQSEFIARLKPGAALFTEIEKDEYVEKPEGVRKHLWDYSLDLIGPGARAAEQVRLCKEAGIPIYMKSEPELSFEAPRLPHVPAMDRWAARAEALASCGADGAWVFPAFRSNYGTSAAELNKYFWWTPTPETDAFLEDFAARIAGEAAGPHVRRAWELASEAIAWSPELPTYYTGPYYLGPAQPMLAEKDAEVPEVFYGHYLFHAEITDADGLKKSPTFFREPTGQVPVFGRYYERMAELLGAANDEMNTARPLVPEAQRLTFDAEAGPIEWFYRTALAQSHFYASCQLRDKLSAAAQVAEPTTEQRAEWAADFTRWREILVAARANAAAAIPLVEDDMRLDWYYGGDHTFPHAADMLRANIELLRRDIEEVLPRLAKQCGVDLV